MTPIKFTYYKTGIQSIDDQHWQIFESMGKIIDVICEKSSENLPAMLDDFSKLITEHFDYEIKMMREMKFPFIETHIIEHDILLALVNRLTTTAKAGNYAEIITSLDKIVIDHIVHYDLLYVSYANNLKLLTGK